MWIFCLSLFQHVSTNYYLKKAWKFKMEKKLYRLTYHGNVKSSFEATLKLFWLFKIERPLNSTDESGSYKHPLPIALKVIWINNESRLKKISCKRDTTMNVPFNGSIVLIRYNGSKLRSNRLKKKQQNYNALDFPSHNFVIRCCFNIIIFLLLFFSFFCIFTGTKKDQNNQINCYTQVLIRQPVIKQSTTV